MHGQLITEVAKYAAKKYRLILYTSSKHNLRPETQEEGSGEKETWKGARSRG
jgi:hypothetical protein